MLVACCNIVLIGIRSIWNRGRWWEDETFVFVDPNSQEGLGRDTSDIKWMDANSQVFVKGEPVGARITVVLLAAYNEGVIWWVQDHVLKGH